MKLLLNLFVFVSVLTLATSCSKDGLDDFDPNDPANQELVIPESKTIEIEIMELINAYRIEQGLSALTNHEIVKGQAFSHTNYMIVNNNVSHDYFYSRKSYLVNNLGAQIVTENVAYGFTNAQAVVNAWLNSDGHRENIEGDFTDFEISAEQNEDGKWYYTNIFIKK